MAVQAGWVGSSAKAETGKGWMSEARLELRLPRAGWMSEMIGKSTEVLFINTVNRTQATIHEIMGSPTSPTIYIFENHATITAATQSGWALQTGAFPAGSVLKIINKGHIRGGGGNGGASGGGGGAGGSALVLNFPASIDNTSGTIWGGGGGGGGAGEGAITAGGGGGAGIPAGAGGAGTIAGSWGSETGGGGGGYISSRSAGGAGGGLGAAGGAGVGGAGGGRGGYSVESNSNAVTWIAVGDRKGSVV